jgi:hypothetical protein
VCLVHLPMHLPNVLCWLMEAPDGDGIFWCSRMTLHAQYRVHQFYRMDYVTCGYVPNIERSAGTL